MLKKLISFFYKNTFFSKEDKGIIDKTGLSENKIHQSTTSYQKLTNQDIAKLNQKTKELKKEELRSLVFSSISYSLSQACTYSSPHSKFADAVRTLGNAQSIHLIDYFIEESTIKIIKKLENNVNESTDLKDLVSKNYESIINESIGIIQLFCASVFASSPNTIN